MTFKDFIKILKYLDRDKMINENTVRNYKDE